MSKTIDKEHIKKLELRLQKIDKLKEQKDEREANRDN